MSHDSPPPPLRPGSQDELRHAPLRDSGSSTIPNHSISRNIYKQFFTLKWVQFTHLITNLAFGLGLFLVISMAMKIASQDRALLKLSDDFRRSTELPVGYHLPELKIVSTNFQPVRLEFSNCKMGHRMLFLSSPSCRYCRESSQAWTLLDREFPGCATEIDISAFHEETKFRSAHEMPLSSAFRYLHTDVYQLYVLGWRATPQTILLNERMIVEKVWTGTFLERHFREALLLIKNASRK